MIVPASNLVEGDWIVNMHGDELRVSKTKVSANGDVVFVAFDRWVPEGSYDQPCDIRNWYEWHEGVELAEL